MTLKTTRLFFLFVLFSISVFSQEASVFNKEGDNFFKNEAYNSAIDSFKKAYAKESSATEKAKLLFKIGESYRQMLDLEQQVVWYRKAQKAKFEDPIIDYHIGYALQQQGNFSEAIIDYNQYLTKKPGDKKTMDAVKECETAQKWIDNPDRFIVEPEVLLNSTQYDFSPAWGDEKHNVLIFTSSRQGSEGSEIDERTGENFQDLFMSERDKKGKWSEPVKYSAILNTTHNDGSVFMTKKGNELFFTRCLAEKDKSLGCDIYSTKKAGSSWGEAQKINFKAGLDDAVTVGHPTLSQDEKVMIFSSDMPGGSGGKDLYVSTYEGKTWSKPVNLGAGINTSANEMFPFMHDDGSLYFSTDGYVGMGGLDVFKAEKSGTNQWANPQNMKYPINSTGDDFGIIFDGSKQRGFLSSSRSGGKGQDDIYSFYIPDLVFAMQGVVYDKESTQPVQGSKVKVIGSDGSSFEATTDENGGFNFAENGNTRYINPEVNYSIEISKPNYLVAKDQISTVGIQESTTFVKEYFITYTAPNKAIAFPEVRYALGKWELLNDGTVTSNDSLDFLFKTLVDNPTIIIELQAHTDSRSSDKSNLELSQKRAQSCVNYLISKGINKDRMIPKGYGETKLRISDATIAKMKTNQEKEAAHAKNRRTEFAVLSFDFVPQKTN
jgi:peptidoglycan-associated lipoprotein